MIYRNKTILILFLLPAISFVLLFLYYPFLSNILNSFYDMTISTQPHTSENFIGLANYTKIFEDREMKIAFFNSIKMMGYAVVFQVGLGMIFAILVDVCRFKQFFRTVYFFPIIISATAIGLMFNLFYDYYNGMFNQILAIFNIAPVYWKSAEHAFIAAVVPTIWQYVGFYFVLMLTGIANIPDDIYEAAYIDGATKFKSVIYITIPLLKSVIKVCIVLSLTGALKVFDLPWVVFYNGAPNGLTHFLGTYMYSQTFLSGNYDYGSTIAIVVVVLGILVSQIANLVLKED